MRRRLAVLSVVVLGAAAITLFPGAGTASHSSKLRVFVAVDTAYAPWYVAKDQGIFTKHGLDVDVTQVTQGGEGVDAILAGVVDVGGSGDATVLSKSVRGPLKALGVIQESGDYIKLVVRKEIANVRDIKRMGYVPGSLSHYGAFKLLDYFKVPRASVRMVAGGPPEMPALLARGDIDGFVIWEPWPSRAVDLGGKVLMKTKGFKYRYAFFIVASGTWFEGHRAEAMRYVRALNEAVRRVEGEPEVAAAATQKEAKIPPEDARKAVQEMEFGVRDFTAEDMRNFEQIAGFLEEQKITSRRASADELVVQGFVTEALVKKATRRSDAITGTYGADKINGLAGNDSISGLEGNDTLSGGAGNDRVTGGTGDDTLVGGPGRDRLNGGPGRDTCRADKGDIKVGCER